MTAARVATTEEVMTRLVCRGIRSVIGMAAQYSAAARRPLNTEIMLVRNTRFGSETTGDVKPQQVGFLARYRSMHWP